MSNPHQPINGVQTRVVKAGEFDFDFCPQFSTDGLTWFRLSLFSFSELTAKGMCRDFTNAAQTLAEKGEVVWRSKE